MMESTEAPNGPAGEPQGGLVLEIGGGHNPYPQSDIIVDKFLENKERGGDLKMDRPVVKADFQQLPFKTGSFAYAICSHVLEHVEDVPSALNELSRVATAGYLETPSALNEAVEPHREYHRWYVARQGRKLIFYPKRIHKTPQQFLLNRLISRNAAFKLFYLSNPDLAFTRLRWTQRVEFEVKSEHDPLDLESLYPLVDQSLMGMITGALGHWFAKRRRQAKQKARAGKPHVDVASILCCPICKGGFRFEAEKMICASCNGFFVREGSLYHLLKEDIRPL